jgi:cytochrome P450
LNIGFGGAFFNIVSPECLQHILRDNFENYHKGKVARKCLRELLGTGIFTADGEVWKFHRKIATSIMTRDMMVHQGVPRVYHTLQDVDIYLRKAAAANQMIDFQDLCFRMTLEVFVHMIFGVELDCVENHSKLVPFMQTFNALQYLSHVS